MSDVKIEPVFEIQDNVQFEWCAFAVYRHPTKSGKYATSSDSGCSCSRWTPLTEKQLQFAEPLDRASARLALTGFLTSQSAFINAGAAIRYLERFEIAMTEDAA